MSLAEGSCMVVRCRKDGDVDVVIDMQVVAEVCVAHAEELGEVDWLDGQFAIRVRVDMERAEGWHLVSSLVNSKERTVLYPPGEKLPPEPIWRPAP